MERFVYQELYENERSNWWYRTRRKILRLFFRKFTALDRNNTNILDVGCGVGANINVLAEFGNVTAVDSCQDAIDFSKTRCASGVKCVKADIICLPFEDESFDIVVALDILEHLEDDISAIREIFRVQKKNGTALVIVPAFKFLWGVQDVVSFHKRRYSLAEIRNKLAACGYDIVNINYSNTLLFVPIFVARLLIKILRIKIKSENSINTKSANWLFEIIYSFESHFLFDIAFPFGVSIVAVCKKI